MAGALRGTLDQSGVAVARLLVRVAAVDQRDGAPVRYSVTIVENGSAKLCHGSGGIVLLRAK